MEQAQANITQQLGVSIGNKLFKEIADGSSLALFIAILLAAAVDFLDFLIIGQIPIIGTAIKLICVIALNVILFDVGGFIKWKVRIILWLATLFEIIPIVATLPLYTLSILWAIYKVKKRAAEAQTELDSMLSTLEKGGFKKI